MTTHDLSAIKVAVQSLMKQNDKFGSFKEAKNKLDKKYPCKDTGDAYKSTNYYNDKGELCAATEGGYVIHYDIDVAKDYPFDSGIICSTRSWDSDYINHIHGADVGERLLFDIFDSHSNGKIDYADKICIRSSDINNDFSEEMTVGELLGFTKSEKIKRTSPKVQPKTQKSEPKQVMPKEKQQKGVQNNQPEQQNTNQNNTGINNSFNNNSGVIIIK